MSGDASGLPARGYRWETFGPNNLAALKHGAMSRFALAEADALAAALAAEHPHLTAADAPALRDYAIAQVRAWRLAAWIEEHGELDDDGKPRPALAALREWLTRAERARARLGADPMSRAALAVDELHVRDLAATLRIAQRERTAAQLEASADG